MMLRVSLSNVLPRPETQANDSHVMEGAFLSVFCAGRFV